MSRISPALVLLSLQVAAPDPSLAAGLPIDPSSIPNPEDLIDPDVISGLLGIVGLGMAHRPYATASPLGTQVGFDCGIEATLVKVPESLVEGLEALGMGESLSAASLPMAKLHVAKGLGDRVGVGLSGIRLTSALWMYGGDLRVTVYQPDEGPTWGIRLAYTKAKLDFVSTETAGFQILMSKNMRFADPYLGVGYGYTQGRVEVSAESNGYEITATGKGVTQAAEAFMGVQLRLPTAGIQATLEGSYSGAGSHTLGTRVGFRF